MSRAGAVDWRGLAGTLAICLCALAASIVGVFILEERAGVRDASTLFLLAVASVAFLRGSWAAVATALGAFLAYNYLFLPPEFTFAVSDSQHVLTLLILLVVGVAIGRLTGLQRDQAQRSERREREASSLFAVSRAIASAKRTRDALPELAAGLAEDAGMARVWIGLGPTRAQEQVVADTQATASLPTTVAHSLLRRAPDKPQPEWVRLSPPGPPAGPKRSDSLFRLELADGDEIVGSIWGARDPRLGLPTQEETRLLAAAADQVGQGMQRDRLADQATELEVTRRSEAMKAAILDSVSHDLRTPLATIRATAGTLADPSLDLPYAQRQTMAREIDAEADRLALLLAGLLDMSRIEGGALRSTPEPIPVSEIVTGALQRARTSLGTRPVASLLPEDLPAVAVDQVLANQVLDNLLENVARHTPPDAPVRISATPAGDAVRLRVEDGGPGVPSEALGHLFEKFYRVPARRGPARQGTGLGLAVVKGMAEAMGGSVSAGASDLGGLAVDLLLPVAGEPPG